MRKDYTILVPNMLPIQFGLMIQIMANYGYKMELLTTEGRSIVEQGLKNVHNDTCYPALLAIGQLMDARGIDTVVVSYKYKRTDIFHNMMNFLL